jgi:hypothetical protein
MSSRDWRSAVVLTYNGLGNILRYSLSARVSLTIRLNTAYYIQRCACCAAGLFAYRVVDRRGELRESKPRGMQVSGCPKEECR